MLTENESTIADGTGLTGPKNPTACPTDVHEEFHDIRSAIHFVGFRGEEYQTACRVWGPPDFIHIGWDRRAQRDIAPVDTIVFANGHGDGPPRARSYPDLIEDPEPDAPLLDEGD